MIILTMSKLELASKQNKLHMKNQYNVAASTNGIQKLFSIGWS